jgi:oligopeptidase B
MNVCVNPKEIPVTENVVAPPIAKRIPHQRIHLGRTLVDEYVWLQNKVDPDVIAHLEAENAYARATLQHTESLQEQIYQEMCARIREDDSSAPQRRGA